MEVHHHPDVHHKKKKFKEYFLEFLMIFLAVTMGFFAESYREQLVDSSKEKEYIAQLTNDLKEDMKECGIGNIRSVASFNKNFADYCDTLIALLSKKNPARSEVISAYYSYNRVTFDWATPYFKDATYTQLRNNGGFSYIRNQTIIREINEYYKWVNIVNDYRDEIKERYAAIIYNEGRKVFDQRMVKVMLDSLNEKGFLSMFEPADSITQYISSTTPIQFASHDAETILKLCNDLASYENLLKASISMIQDQGKRAQDLVEEIEKEYDVKSKN
jgi:hypothetical protein